MNSVLERMTKEKRRRLVDDGFVGDVQRLVMSTDSYVTEMEMDKVLSLLRA